MKTLLTIDKLVILGRASEFLERWLSKNTTTEVESRNSAKWPYRWNYHMVDGSLLQVGENKPGERPKIRFEFNPNKAIHSYEYDGKFSMGIVESVLTKIRFDRVSRIDIAIDYYGDLRSVRWSEPGGRKRRPIYSGSGELETLYIGSRESELMWRIYNKAKEQKNDSKGHWWRVEAEIKFSKGSGLHPWYDPFVGLEGRLGHELLGLSWEEMAKVEFLENHPEVWGTLNGRTRKKYRELMGRIGEEIDPQPSLIWENEKDNVLAHIASYEKLATLLACNDSIA